MIKIQCFLKKFLGLAPQSKKLTTRLQTFPTPPPYHARGNFILNENMWTAPKFMCYSPLKRTLCCALK